MRMEKGTHSKSAAGTTQKRVVLVGADSLAGTGAADDFIKSRIFTIRGVQVMLSSDLAALYEVEVKYLHRQVKRNANRFPPDFAFHLATDEVTALRCQNVTSKRGGDRYGLFAFTEQGVAMLSSVLKSERAAEVNVEIMRVFVAMRKALASVAPLLSRIDTIERRQIADQQRNEERFDTIFKAMDGGDDFISDAVKRGADAGVLPLSMLPAALFLLASVIAFSTGTSWGTFGILIPIAVAVCNKVDPSLNALVLSSILSGSVMGDHCSPISDTTILSSTGSQCRHIDHVRTQLPYALTVGAVSAIGYVVAGLTRSLAYGVSAAVTLAVSAVLLVVALLVLPRAFPMRREASVA